LSKSIAVRYSNQGIRCNVISPGSTRTNISATSGEEIHEDGLRMINEIAGHNLFRLAGDPEDVAQTALFLCSDEAKHINGAVVPVDGGLNAC